MRYNTITAIGTFTALEGAAADYLHLVPSRCSGGDDAEVDMDMEPAAGADGVDVFSILDGQMPITLSGDLLITSTGVDAAYLAAVDTLLASLKTALNALKAAPDDLVHSGGTLSVWKRGKLDPVWDDDTKILSVTFGLLVANGP